MTQLGRGAYDNSFAEALRAAIAERGLSLSRIQAHLTDLGQHVGVATLSTWQRGDRVPGDTSLDVIAALEDVLRMPPASLRGLLPSARLAATRPGKPFSSVDYAGTLRAMLDRLETDAPSRSRTVSVVEELLIAEDRSLHRKRVTQAVTAIRPVDRVVAVHCAEPAARMRDLALEAMAGCRLGKVVRDDKTHLLASELLLDRQLPAGESAIVQFQVHDLSGRAMEEYYRIHDWHAAQHVLEVAFHPRTLPARVIEFRRTSSGAPDRLRRELRLTPDHRAQVVVASTEPGLVGMRWEWE